MDRPTHRTEGTPQQCRPCHDGFAPFLGFSFLLLFTGCAQLDQLMGKPAASAESQPPAQSANTAPGISAPASGKSPVQAGETAQRPAAKKKTDESRPAGSAKQPEPELKQAYQDKALAESDQLKKEKKSRVASDKKSTKKPPKSQVESQPPTEDVFLSPIPLPSKPAAIGGSGG